MGDIFVSAPTLEFKEVDTGMAVLEKPLEVRCGEVTFPDGTMFNQDTLGTPSTTAGFFIYRQQSAASTEIWNENKKLWEPEPGSVVANMKPNTLIFKEGVPFPWRAPLIAAGQKDKNGQDQFQKATPLFPRYFVRAYFFTTRNGDTFRGLSASSSPVRFISSIDAIRAGVKVGDDQTPEEAKEVLLFLRDAAREFLGTIEIRSENGSARIEISNRQAATQKAVIRVLPSGDVEIRPAAGRSVILGGLIDADRIFYQPADVAGTPVGPKRWLP